MTWNSADVLAGCLESLRAQHCRDFQVVVWDNASTDGTQEVLAGFADVVSAVLAGKANLGFAAGHNRVLAGRTCPYVLFLNPDTRLDPHFLERLVAAFLKYPQCGSLSPKILKLEPAGEDEKQPPILDSTGIIWTRQQRHFDRGSGEPDQGQYDQPEYVFGVTGAVAAYRLECLRDVAVGGEVWDEDFFAYREDADLAWRAAWRGWRCLYLPDLIAWHRRQVLPIGRRRVDAAINRHSVKNRFLLRLKNMPLLSWLRLALPITARDLVVVGGVLFTEWRSLPAFYQVFRLLPRMLAKRRFILGRAKLTRTEMEIWFRRGSIPL